MSLKREGTWLLAALLFGIVALPLLVYLTGRAVLGRYAGDGFAAFFVAYLADLVRLHWFACALALGPVALVALWRIRARLTAV